jgi:hypothetical protein
LAIQIIISLWNQCFVSVQTNKYLKRDDWRNIPGQLFMKQH